MGKGGFEDGDPVGDDAGPPAAVVGEQRGEAETAGEVEGRLDRLAHAGLGLVGVEQFDDDAVCLTPDALLERGDLLA